MYTSEHRVEKDVDTGTVQPDTKRGNRSDTAKRNIAGGTQADAGKYLAATQENTGNNTGTSMKADATFGTKVNQKNNIEVNTKTDTGINTKINTVVRSGFVYLCVSLFVALFGAIYEHFSHQVYSAPMIYAFAYPLAGGTFPFMLLLFFRARYLPPKAAMNLYNAGIATLTMGSIVYGVLEIYGTTNPLSIVYPIAGGILTLAGILCYIRELASRRRGREL